MGCCVSSNKPTPPPPSTKLSRTPPPPPSPPHPVEEKVKEVLSETPNPKPRIPISLEQDNYVPQLKKNPNTVNSDEISDVSEIYSTLSESISTNTERRDNEEDNEVRQRVVTSAEKLKLNRRSFSGDFTGKKERGTAKSPATRPDPSPGRARIVPGRERRSIQDARERDAGESSRRRSRSPAVRNDGGGSRQSLGRSPSVRKTGRSPGRVRSDLTDKTRKVDGGNNREGKWPPTSNELLENPLVSLECFIFL